MPRSPRTADPAIRIGIDTGGTFTDVVVLRGHGRNPSVDVFKVPSQPANPANAVLDGASRTGVPSAEIDLIHGTTVGLNAILTGRNLARTAFVTNRGFRDAIEIGRQARRNLYALEPSKGTPPVPRHLRFEVPSRRSAGGEQLEKPTRTDLDKLYKQLKRAKVEAVAIGLLHSCSHPEDEHTVATALRKLDIPITCSADLLPSSRGEYERFCSAILNAAITPLVAAHVRQIEAGIHPGRVRLLRSSGAGIMPGQEALEFPARAILSGPAGGALAAARLAANWSPKPPNAVVTIDIGGTSADVCVVEPDTLARGDLELGHGLPLHVPAVDVHTIGCGGGSIARKDAGGALRVGPESAGADPGPAAYGRGGVDPTVTDAHLVLGHLGADTLLAGEHPVDVNLAVEAIGRLARQMGVPLRRAAEGILEVSNIAMARAVLVMTAQRGIDTATIPLLAFGGAGGLHAAALAERLGIRDVVVPAHAGAFSAVGLALATDADETATPVLRPLQDLTEVELQRVVRSTVQRLDRPNATDTLVELGMRLQGQGEPLAVATHPTRTRVATAVEQFAEIHGRVHGFQPSSEQIIELVEVRATATEPPLASWPRSKRHRNGTSHRGYLRRPPTGSPVTVYQGDELGAGQRVRGPCSIEEFSGTVFVPPQWEARGTPIGWALRRGRHNK